MADELVIEEPNAKPWRRRRGLIVLMLFFGQLTSAANRFIISITIVPMTQEEFDWNSFQVGVLLSAYFYGYFLTQFIGGLLATKFGGSNIYAIGKIGATIFTILLPFAARADFIILIASRVLAGGFDGISFPAFNHVLSKWVPPLERTKSLSIVFAGSNIGVLVVFIFSGIIILFINWESVYYIFGAVSIIWFLFFVAIVRQSPKHDKRISIEEKTYIMSLLEAEEKERGSTPIPWKSIFTSLPVYSIVIAHFAQNWGAYTLLTQIPLFFVNVLDMDLISLGLFVAIMYGVVIAMMVVAGFLADWIQKRSFLTTVQVRKLFTTLSFGFQAFGLITVAYIRNTFAILFIMGLCGIFAVFSVSGFTANYLDIASFFAGAIVGLSNTVASTPGMISPIITGLIVTDHSNADQWQYVFILAASIFVLANIFYLIFASGEVQSWAKAKEPPKETPEEVTEEDKA